MLKFEVCNLVQDNLSWSWYLGGIYLTFVSYSLYLSNSWMGLDLH